MPYKNKEEYKKYYQRNREQRLEYQRKYYIENKEERNEYHKKRYYQNKEILEYNKKYSNEYRKTEKGKKVNTIGSWKHQGMKCEDWDSLYEIYIHTWNCEYCKKDFKNTLDRCLDHNHTNGQIRAILCRECNVNDILN